MYVYFTFYNKYYVVHTTVENNLSPHNARYENLKHEHDTMVRAQKFHQNVGKIHQKKFTHAFDNNKGARKTEKKSSYRR